MEQETITVELTHEDAIKLVRSVEIWKLTPVQYNEVMRMSLVFGHRMLYHWDWVDVNSQEWDKFTTRQLYDLYNNIK